MRTQTLTSAAPPIGALLREWRQQRRRSQLDLALDAGVSQRHLSFLESGRATPSRDMVVRLAEELNVPLRDRNALLLAAGYAPLYAEKALDEPEMRAVRTAIERMLHAHLPHPALVVDRHWTLIEANQAVAPLLDGVVEHTLLRPPVNVLRLSLHPLGLAPRIVNLAEWRAHLLERLRRQVETTADPVLAALLAELSTLPSPAPAQQDIVRASILVPLELETKAGRLSLISTTTVFGTPTEVTLSELAIEAFYPADDVTAARLGRLRGVGKLKR